MHGQRIQDTLKPTVAMISGLLQSAAVCRHGVGL